MKMVQSSDPLLVRYYLFTSNSVEILYCSTGWGHPKYTWLTWLCQVLKIKMTINCELESLT